jgi:primase-polymerase (primpol)-like protein
MPLSSGSARASRAEPLEVCRVGACPTTYLPGDGVPAHASLEQAVAVAKRRVDGIGFVFNGDGIGGVDFDGCRDPATGEISPWAREVIADFASYAEVSPSGTGVKIIAGGAPAALPANKISLGTEPAFGGEHPPQIEAYVTRRYFTLTGRHLEETSDAIVDATEAWERLARRL